MNVTVLAFARIREILGGGAHRMELAPGSTARDLWRALAGRSTAIDLLAASTRIARNGRIVTLDEPLFDGDEIALLPPAGGG